MQLQQLANCMRNLYFRGTHGRLPLKIKSGNEMASDRKDNTRLQKMSEKFANRYGKRILQRKHAKTPEKTHVNHYSIYS